MSQARTGTTRQQAGNSGAGRQASGGADGDAAAFAPSQMTHAMKDSLLLGANAMRHWVEASQDIAHFCNARLAKDFAYLTEIGTCRSPAQLAAVWCRATSEAAHDYADQLDRVMAINLNGAASPAGER